MDFTFAVEYAKSGRSTCKGSKQKIPKGALRLGKVPPEPDPEASVFMPASVQWFLLDPFFTMMRRMRSKKLENVEELAGFSDLSPEDQTAIRDKLKAFWDGTMVFTPAPKPAKKRPAPAEDGAAAAAAPAVSSGGGAAAEEEDDSKPTPAAPQAKRAKKNDPTYDANVVPFSVQEARQLAATVLEMAREAKIRLPSDEAAARTEVGSELMNAQTGGEVDLGAVLTELHKRFGSTKGAELDCANDANQEMATLFKELATYYFKMGDKMRGITTNKVSKKLQEHPVAITSGKQAVKLDGIGKSSGSKIDEFLLTGKMAVLEEFRSST